MEKGNLNNNDKDKIGIKEIFFLLFILTLGIALIFSTYKFIFVPANRDFGVTLAESSMDLDDKKEALNNRVKEGVYVCYNDDIDIYISKDTEYIILLNESKQNKKTDLECYSEYASIRNYGTVQFGRGPLVPNIIVKSLDSKYYLYPIKEKLGETITKEENDKLKKYMTYEELNNTLLNYEGLFYNLKK